MIRRLYIDNFKCLVNFELNLQDLTLLVGPNGVGKTSVLDVVFALRQLLAGTAKVTDLGAFPTSTLTRWQKRNMQVFELDAVLEGITTDIGWKWNTTRQTAGHGLGWNGWK